MKKRTLIIAIVLILVASISVVTFAAWDTLSADKSLSIAVGSNVNIKHVDVKASTDPQTKRLVPVGAEFLAADSKAVTEMKFGTFKVQNDAVNGLPATTNGGALKIKMTLAEATFSHADRPDVTPQNDIVKFNTYFKIIIKVGEEGRVIYDSSSLDVGLNSKVLLDLDMVYDISVAFKNTAASLDVTNADVKSLVNSTIAIKLNLKAVDPLIS